MDKCPIDGKNLLQVNAMDSTYSRCGQHHYFNSDGVQVHDPTDRRLPEKGMPVEAPKPKRKAAKKKAAKK